MFSNRINKHLVYNELYYLLKDKKYEDIINLIESNPTKTDLIHKKKILQSFLFKENLYYNPDSKGLINARNIIINYYYKKNINLNLEQIIITSSTSEAYSFLFKILCNPDDNILIPYPGYPLFEYLASFENINIKKYKLDYSDKIGFFIDIDFLKKQIDKKTKAIVLINPNNPTGSYISENEKNNLINILKEKNISLIVDEVFHDYTLNNQNYLSFANEKNLLCFTLSGISKILALPQMKLSWIVISGPKKLINEAIHRLEIVVDTYLSTSIPIQNALRALFNYQEYIQKKITLRINYNYNYLNKIFQNSPFKLLKSSGGWSAIIEVPKIYSEDEWLKKLLLEKNCLIYPGYFFDFDKEAYLIISLIIKNNILKKGVECIKSLIE